MAGRAGQVPGLHSTTRYAALFRYDDEIIVNPHVYGEPASANPALHLRRLDGGTSPPITWPPLTGCGPRPSLGPAATFKEGGR